MTRVGNKTRLLPILYAVFPKEVPRYIDVFGGSGAVLLGKPKSKFEVFNDVDGELVNLFHCIRDRLEELLVELNLFPLNSREEFDAWLKLHDRGARIEEFADLQMELLDQDPRMELAQIMKQIVRRRADYPEIRRAVAYFMRVRNSYASTGKSFACQPFNIETMYDQMEEMSGRIKEVIVERQSFEILIPHYDREDSFFYADPPYYNSEHFYDADFGWEQHVLLRDTLYNIKGKFLLSQVDCPEIRELYKECDMLDFRRIHSMAVRTNPGSQFRELLIGNYDLLEQERDKPAQISLDEMMGLPVDTEKLMKERILPCPKTKSN